MNPTTLKFAALMLGFALWAALAYLKMVPVEPLVALLQMGLGGLVTHMLQADNSGPTPAPKPEGGFASVRLLAIIAAVVLGLSMFAGCTTAAVAWESAAANELRQANDNAVHIWMASGCVLPVGAVLRNPQIIDSVNRFCNGPQNQQLGAGQPINITVQVPSAASAASNPK